MSEPGITFTKFGDPLVNDGWEDNVEYDFELTYTANSIEIFIQGGTGTFATQQQIYDLNIGDLPAGTFPGDVFPSGRFGFYNNSQEDVRYRSFTAVIPEPTAVLPITVAIAGLFGRRRRRN